MAYLVSEIVLALIFAAAVGALFGWLLRGLIIDRELEQLKVLVKRRQDDARRERPPDAAPPEPRHRLLEQQLTEQRDRLHASERRAAELEEELRQRAGRIPGPVDIPPGGLRARGAELPSPTEDAVAVRVHATLDDHEDGASKPRAHDDLKLLKGVGPAVERALIAAGVTCFADIAEWDDAERARIVATLREDLRSPIRSATWINDALAQLAAQRKAETSGSGA